MPSSRRSISSVLLCSRKAHCESAEGPAVAGSAAGPAVAGSAAGMFRATAIASEKRGPARTLM